MSNPFIKPLAGLLTTVGLLFAAASHSEILTVPYRAGSSMQTAATTIEFQPTSLGSTPTVTVDGASVTVPDISCVDAACTDTNLTPGGDVIAVYRESGTNVIQVTLTYLSQFTAGNYCSYSGGTTARTYDVTLADFTFSTPDPSYRITSFMAPSDASCDIAYARVPTARPSFPPAGPWTKLGRLPLNVVLVLDKSGSMNWTVPGSSDIRWDRLTNSVNLFTSVWDAVGAPPPPATQSSEGDPRDNLGLIFFSTTSEERNLGSSTFFESRGSSTAPWGSTVAGLLSAEPVGGWTSVGAGLVNARARLDDVDAVLGDTAIVLFTDGEQNRPPCVVREGETITPTPVPYPGSSSTYMDECFVTGGIADSALLQISGTILPQDILPRGPIFTIGLGEGGMGASAQLLDEISTETSGSAWFPNNGVAMDSSFVDSLVTNLRGGTVSLLDRVQETIPAEAPGGSPAGFAVDASVTRVVFVLSWNGPAFQEISLNIQSPGVEAMNPSQQSSGTNFRVVSYDVRAGDAGDWVAAVTRHSNRDIDLEYQLSAYAVESMFSSSVMVNERLATGQSIDVVADLSWGNEVLKGLPAGAVKAYLEKPGENLGTILFQSSFPQDFEVSDDASPLALKIDALASREQLIDRIDPRATGNQLDLQESDAGRFTGSFGNLDVGGTYRIRVEFDWDDARTGKVRRVQYWERQVRVLPSAEASETTPLLDGQGNLAGLQIVLMDDFGNHVGPGFGGQIQVTVNGSSDQTTITDPDVRGVYEVVNPGLVRADDPDVQVTFGDTVVADDKLSDLIGGDGGPSEPPGNGDDSCAWYDLSCGPVLLKFIVLLLILLVVFLVFRKR